MPDDTRPAWADAFFAARDEMRRWISDALKRHGDVPFAGIHDEGSFIASWFGFHQIFGAPEVLEFARFLRDGFAAWARQHMHHGFYREGEAHHQTEIFTCFLARLWQVAPDDATAELIVDAAHHIGNWVEGIPAWYNWDAHRFLSWRIGTERVGSGASSGYQVPDHFRLIQMALVAHRITGEQRYLDLSAAYAARWTRAILEAPSGGLPTVLYSGDSEADRDEVLRAVGAHHRGDSPLDRVEPHVPAGTIDVLLDLYALTGDEACALAARRLCEALLPALADPYSNPPGALLNRYRVATGDGSLDRDIHERLTAGIEEQLAALDGMLHFLAKTRMSGYALAAGRLYAALADNPFAADRLEDRAERYRELVGERPRMGARVETPVMVIETLSRKPVAGIGKRSDMVRWGWENELGALRPTSSPPPPSLMLAWQLTGDDALATGALRLIAERMALARSALRDGRTHGCAGSTIGAVASGHGRDGGYGNVTGALLPLAAGMLRDLAQERPTVRFRRPDGGEHLPAQVASLVRLRPRADAQVWLHNDGDASLTLDVAGPAGEWTRVELGAGETTKRRVR